MMSSDPVSIVTQVHSVTAVVTIGRRPPKVCCVGCCRVGVVGVVSQVCRFVVRVVVMAAHAAVEALTQVQFGGELSDSLPLVQDGFFLLHQTLPQVQDCRFCLLRHSPPAVAVPVRSAVVSGTGATRATWAARRGETPGIGVSGNGGTNETRMRVVVRTWHSSPSAYGKTDGIEEEQGNTFTHPESYCGACWMHIC